MRYDVILIACLAHLAVTTCFAQRPLDRGFHHLRQGTEQEWSSFPKVAESDSLDLSFESASNGEAWCLQFRQQDVKLSWTVSLNKRPLGTLPIDENDMLLYFEIPPRVLRDGTNQLRVAPNRGGRQASDDIRVGEFVLHEQPRSRVLGETTLDLEVRNHEDGELLPCRVTVVNASGALQSMLADDAPTFALRPGIAYTATGCVQLSLPAGDYTISAGRGFEYSRARQHITIGQHQTQKLVLDLTREVPTAGLVACDTHVHSRTHSGHGDATVLERMVTLAGEGIELPIATDHNAHIDHQPFAEEVGVRRYFTPVIGNEVTTPVGHFNIFPVQSDAPIPNFQLDDFDAILAGIYRTPGVKVAILNHARDLHSGVRPFGPKLHHALVGENLAGWPLRFNAMEVVNSSATQSRPLQLLSDWMGLLNRGLKVTPVGSSDSHDVGRHFVGQARTYIRCDDRDPGNIDVDQAVRNFVQGQVLVSYGLLVDLQVDGKYRPGEVGPVLDDEVDILVRVMGPSWVSANQLTLFANGQQLRRITIPPRESATEPGKLWEQRWTVPAPPHDVHLVAVAVGPGITDLAWPTAKPYQPTSPDWTAQVIGASGAVWLDVDGNGRPTSAYEYARRLIQGVSAEPAAVLSSLAGYDAAVAAQAAHALQSGSVQLLSQDWQRALKAASPATRTGFSQYLDGWRESQRARL